MFTTTTWSRRFRCLNWEMSFDSRSTAAAGDSSRRDWRHRRSPRELQPPSRKSCRANVALHRSQGRPAGFNQFAIEEPARAWRPPRLGSASRYEAHARQNDAGRVHQSYVLEHGKGADQAGGRRRRLAMAAKPMAIVLPTRPQAPISQTRPWIAPSCSWKRRS